MLVVAYDLEWLLEIEWDNYRERLSSFRSNFVSCVVELRL